MKKDTTFVNELEEIGSADGIAEHLKTLQIKGIPTSEDSCAMAIAMDKFTDNQHSWFMRINLRMLLHGQWLRIRPALSICCPDCRAHLQQGAEKMHRTTATVSACESRIMFSISTPPMLSGGWVPAMYGDANLDGRIDGTDYSRIDNGCLKHFTGWANGEFNYDGVVNGSDYTLIDNSFNTQYPSYQFTRFSQPLTQTFADQNGNQVNEWDGATILTDAATGISVTPSDYQAGQPVTIVNGAATSTLFAQTSIRQITDYGTTTTQTVTDVCSTNPGGSFFVNIPKAVTSPNIVLDLLQDPVANMGVLSSGGEIELTAFDASNNQILDESFKITPVNYSSPFYVEDVYVPVYAATDIGSILVRFAGSDGSVRGVMVR